MGSSNIIIREYLESLKEDQELDYLFPILLNIMGFKIVSTPRESKGQPQYGKDIIAVGIDSNDEVRKRFYFELKGHSDRNIDDTVFSKKDGIRDSLISAKCGKFSDASIPKFDELPIKYVLVHNGVVKSNTRTLLEGFIKDEFPQGNFERWDIHTLTDLFSKYLFSEYLLTDTPSLRLFKKTLALLDAPENQYVDFYKLVDLQIKKIQTVKGRTLRKFFSTQCLLAAVVLHYSTENKNLEAAKQCLTYLLLKTWAWILENKLEHKRSVQREFRKLVSLHFKMLQDYFGKSLSVARSKDGLFYESGGMFEEVGYPLRCFEYLNYLIYYFQARHYYPKFEAPSEKSRQGRLLKLQKNILKELIENNSGCKRPLMDNHSIAIVSVFLFFLNNRETMTQDDERFLAEYMGDCLNQIELVKKVRDRFPLLHNNENILVETVAAMKRHDEYEDSSSLLITFLFEFMAIMKLEMFHKHFKPSFEGKINLQTAYPKTDAYDIEQCLFERHLNQEMSCETNISLEESLDVFNEKVGRSQLEEIKYRTDAAGFPYIRSLAHVYYKTEWFPQDWRHLYSYDT